MKILASRFSEKGMKLQLISAKFLEQYILKKCFKKTIEMCKGDTDPPPRANVCGKRSSGPTDKGDVEDLHCLQRYKKNLQGLKYILIREFKPLIP